MNYILEGELFSVENNITHMLPKCKPFLKKNETMRVHLKIAGIDAHICQHAPDEPGKRAKNAIFQVRACTDELELKIMGALM